MDTSKTFAKIQEYRSKLLTCGRSVIFENPDKLNEQQMMALEERIFRELNEIDMSLGYEYYDTGMRIPAGISKEQQDELYMDFLDWYQVLPTPSGKIYDYVVKNYSTDRYPRIICVGDGKNCHLGRKLAMKGYNVVSVDPQAQKRKSYGKLGGLGGKLHIVKGQFLRESSDMIDWADLIVGSKIPQCAEELIGLSKPAVFNISNNAEIYKMRFKGKFIKSSEELTNQIAKCKGVSVKKIDDDLGESNIFVCEGIQHEQEKEI